MLSGDLPFRAPDERTVTQLIRHEPAPPLSRVAVVPGSLERIVQRCLEKMPGDRFQSAAELALALEDVMREFGGGSAQRIIGGALAAAGMVDEAPRSLGEIPPPIASIPPRASLGPALRGLITCFLLILGGGGVIQYLAWRTGGGSPARGTTSRLELAPMRAGYLRVVADPWAHVIVDGERVETTPFARAIPLSAGTHYVRLEHPNAPTERRTIVLAAGETVLLDVKMKVTTASTDAAGVELVTPTDAGIDVPATP
jgi:serine/threonine-protein kinase